MQWFNVMIQIRIQIFFPLSVFFCLITGFGNIFPALVWMLWPLEGFLLVILVLFKVCYDGWPWKRESFFFFLADWALEKLRLSWDPKPRRVEEDMFEDRGQEQDGGSAEERRLVPSLLLLWLVEGLGAHWEMKWIILGMQFSVFHWGVRAGTNSAVQLVSVWFSGSVCVCVCLCVCVPRLQVKW